ncbi:protein CD300H-like [Protopterus annectens]|uniref:protein CD300H-like n=1 Tax=Protopterus annectens TaxID=7888 RepID=UPI001CFBB08B|nr:protein CD300H-like [Protopterus annectens]
MKFMYFVYQDSEVDVNDEKVRESTPAVQGNSIINTFRPTLAQTGSKDGVLGCVTSSAKIAVQGTEGRSVLISWSYDASYKDNAKFFCRGNYLPVTLKKLIESNANKNDQNVTNDKYSLYDNKSAALLIVTINNLTQDDNGIYHCGIDKFSFDTYVLVQVSVTEVRTTDSPLSTSTIHTDSKSQPQSSTLGHTYSNGESSIPLQQKNYCIKHGNK